MPYAVAAELHELRVVSNGERVKSAARAITVVRRSSNPPVGSQQVQQAAVRLTSAFDAPSPGAHANPRASHLRVSVPVTAKPRGSVDETGRSHVGDFNRGTPRSLTTIQDVGARQSAAHEGRFLRPRAIKEAFRRQGIGAGPAEGTRTASVHAVEVKRADEEG